MKKILTFVLAIASMISVACKPSNKVELDSSKCSTIIKEESYEILFNYSNIDTIIYLEDDDCYVVHYCDPDCFDLDQMAERTGREHWYGNYIAIDIEDETLPDFLFDYNSYKSTKDWNTKFRLSDKYVIIERDLTFEDYSHDIIFYIGLNPDVDD